MASANAVNIVSSSSVTVDDRCEAAEAERDLPGVGIALVLPVAGIPDGRAFAPSVVDMRSKLRTAYCQVLPRKVTGSRFDVREKDLGPDSDAGVVENVAPREPPAMFSASCGARHS